MHKTKFTTRLNFVFYDYFDILNAGLYSHCHAKLSIGFNGTQ